MRCFGAFLVAARPGTVGRVTPCAPDFTTCGRVRYNNDGAQGTDAPYQNLRGGRSASRLRLGQRVSCWWFWSAQTWLRFGTGRHVSQFSAFCMGVAKPARTGRHVSPAESGEVSPQSKDALQKKKPRIAPGLCIETDQITCCGGGRSAGMLLRDPR